MAQADASEQKQEKANKKDLKVEIDFAQATQFEYIDCHELAKWIILKSKLDQEKQKNDKVKEKGKEYENKFIIIDVRDYDYGPLKIQGSINKKSSTLNRNELQMIAKQYKDYKNIIFHCRFSQARGPSAARGYLLQKATNQDVFKDYPKQNVFVLEGGILDFQKSYTNLCENVN